MILTLLSMLGGGLMRLLPEVFALFNKKTDYAQELAMMDKQLELQRSRSSSDLEELRTGMDGMEVLAMLEAQKAAVVSQMQVTGMRFVDALNFLVRPLVTYYFLGCYGIVKTAMIYVALTSSTPWTSIIMTWNEEDGAILSGILAFWFVGRVFEKRS